ncbi:MAG: ribosome silencing factor [Candidatus Marinimicrobia bacterium]|nr:ribosome silencing factor [Candidatus Neomarinimicrobiota bacterium]
MANAALEKKAEDIKILDLTGITDIADHFVIITGNGSLHVKAIADHIRDGMDTSSKPWHIEGYDTLKWVLLDYVDVVIHIFEKETRDYYDIERLWADAEITTISDEE